MASKKTRTATKTNDDALSLLKEDHAQVRKLFARFEKLGEDDEADKEQLIALVCKALSVHATLEEELFYPSVRGKIEEEALLDVADVEHRVAKQLIAELEEGHLDETRRDASFKVLGEYVQHHIEEEEGELFEQVRKCAVNLEALGQEMLARKEDLARELGLEELQAQFAERPRIPATERVAALQ
jgi:hemerythrin superfamily protein